MSKVEITKDEASTDVYVDGVEMAVRVMGGRSTNFHRPDADAAPDEPAPECTAWKKSPSSKWTFMPLYHAVVWRLPCGECYPDHIE